MFLDGETVDAQQRDAYLKRPADWLLARARSRWPKILKFGVGAVRDAGDKHGVGLALAKDAREHADKRGSTPYIDSPGAAIHRRGRYGSFLAEPIEDFASAADCVAARVAAGADRIKLLVSGIINFQAGRVTAPPQLSAAEVAALVEAARRHGRPTFAHASGVDGIENAIEGGVNTVEHGYFITCDQLAKMRDRRIGWVPTFAPVQLQIDRAADLGWSGDVVGHLERIIEGHQKMLCHAHEIGVPVLAGSDAGSCGVPHGLGLLQELCHMERAGVSTMAVLRAATGVSAALLNIPEPVGRIAVDCRPRMILTRHSPAATVANLRRAKAIVFDGEATSCGTDCDATGL
jgi:imidazolonepropionase-like amidohydrolase